MKKTILIFKSMFFIIIFLSACTNVDTNQHIEVFMTITMDENEEGYEVENGYKKVNSITTLEKSKYHIKTDIKAIKDYYDIEGKYLKTVILHSKFNKSNITLAEEGDDTKIELNKSSTIFIPNGTLGDFKLDNMSDEETGKVKKHVLSFMDKLDKN
ncbi:hypothetical protein ACFSCX_19300 [Bacillus salitolerans]|uniref:Lipoprotein n=1 Tax=Bacillus salitolerans TaxID=1437434 RepID=A0ABW4LWX7_9BACI